MARAAYPPSLQCANQWATLKLGEQSKLKWSEYLAKNVKEKKKKKEKKRKEGLCVGKYAATALDNSFSFSFRLNLSSGTGSVSLWGVAGWN